MGKADSCASYPKGEAEGGFAALYPLIMVGAGWTMYQLLYTIFPENGSASQKIQTFSVAIFPFLRYNIFWNKTHREELSHGMAGNYH